MMEAVKAMAKTQPNKDLTINQIYCCFFKWFNWRIFSNIMLYCNDLINLY